MAPASAVARGLAIAFLLSFGPTVSNSFARFAYALVLPAMRADLQWSWAQAGAINTANAAGYLLGALLVRLCVRRAGNRALFCGGMVLTALALAGTGLVRAEAALAGMRLLSGVGGAAVFVCGGALAANVFPAAPARATGAIAIYFAGGGFGLVAAGIALPLLLEARGDAAWPVAWLWMGAASAAMTVAAAWAALRIEEPGAAAGSARWRLRPLLPAMLAYACFALGYIGYMTFVIAWMRANRAGTHEVIAVWTTLGVATLAAPIAWGALLERRADGRPLAAVMAVLTAGAALPLLSAGIGTMLLSALLFGLAMFSAPSAIGTLVKKRLDKPAWGGAMAVFTMVFAAGQIGGPIVTGWLADRHGSLAPGLAGSAALLALGAALALAQRAPRPADA